MTIIDSEVHAYETNTPQRPWYSVPVTGAASHDWRGHAHYGEFPRGTMAR
jgi:hypothetical protein